ncbi:MAG: hypothetical protein E7588_03475 [Ruminococcaceae bacterium]|nr:hypothetical protein [Oscillospiraceae bacterium]
MKKLLNVLRSKWFIIILAVFLSIMFALAAVKGAEREEKRIVAYDYHFYDSFREGMPDYGLRNRRNILPQH